MEAVKIHVLSDLHLGRSDEAWAPPATDADVVVLAGDIRSTVEKTMAWAREHFEVPTVMIAGNHEFLRRRLLADVRAGIAASDDRLRFLENDYTIIGDTRFVGATLWTDFALYGAGTVRNAFKDCWSMVDFDMIRLDDPVPGLDPIRFMPWHAAGLHETSRMAIESVLATPHDGPTVVVTHHAPHPNSVSPLFEGHPGNPAFVSDLSELIDRYQPDLWIHGHVHTSFDYEIGRTRVVCNPHGNALENRQFDAGLVVEVGSPVPLLDRSVPAV